MRTTGSSDSAAEIIRDIEDTGRTIELVEVRGARSIKVSKPRSMPDDLMAVLKSNREAIIAELSARRGPYDPFELDRAVERFEARSGAKLDDGHLVEAMIWLMNRGLHSGFASPADCDTAAVANAKAS